MKRIHKLLAVLFVCAFFTSSAQVAVLAADTDVYELDPVENIILYLPKEQAEYLDAELDYSSKIVELDERGASPRTTYTISIDAYKTKAQSLGYVDSGKTIYINCKGGNITGTLYYGATYSNCANVAFSQTTSVVDRTCLSTGKYYKFSMYNETGSTISLSLTVYTY